MHRSYIYAILIIYGFHFFYALNEFIKQYSPFKWVKNLECE